MLQRLDKILSNSGRLTRSQARDALKAGRVAVYGETVRDGAAKFDPETTPVTLDGAPIAGGTVVLLLNKPAGYVTATRDSRFPTVMDLLPSVYRRRVVPVGRLDKDTEGLLLLTDDGELAHRLIAPRFQVPKVYYARRMLAARGMPVSYLERRAEGGLTLGDLPRGQVRLLTQEERRLLTGDG